MSRHRCDADTCFRVNGICQNALEAQRRARIRAGRRLTKPMRKMQEERDRRAETLRAETRCTIPLECPHGGPRYCRKASHRQSAWPVPEPEVEMLRGDKWEPVSVNPGSRYSPRLTWKALRESGALA